LKIDYGNKLVSKSLDTKFIGIRICRQYAVLDYAFKNYT